MYPALNRWFALGGSPEKEYRQRHKPEELLCVTAAVPKPRPMYELAAALGNERTSAARKRLAALTPEARRQQLRKDWTTLLGEVAPKAAPKASSQGVQKLGDATVERIVLEVEPSIVVPALLLLPPRKEGSKLPIVVGFAQQGKAEFLRNRPEAIAELVRGGCAVCLPDLRGTGETRPGDGRGRQSSGDLDFRDRVDAWPTARSAPGCGTCARCWHTCAAGRNWTPPASACGAIPSPRPIRKTANLKVPLDAEKLPVQAEPLGGLLALLGGLFEPEVRAVYGQGGLAGYQSLLQSQFCYVPHDAVVPGALTVGDLADVAGALAPRPLRLEGLVDGLNRRVNADVLTKTYEPVRNAYRATKAADRLVVEATPGKPSVWLLAQLKKK